MDDQGPGLVLSVMGGGQGPEQGAALSVWLESGRETTQQPSFPSACWWGSWRVLPSWGVALKT